MEIVFDYAFKLKVALNPFFTPIRIFLLFCAELELLFEAFNKMLRIFSKKIT
jgi:hypothetical protein